jgi:hypothetical protein
MILRGMAWPPIDSGILVAGPLIKVKGILHSFRYSAGDYILYTTAYRRAFF